MKKQTAVEWFTEKLNEFNGKDNPWFDIPLSLLDQAKAMEREQALEIWMQFFKDSYHTKPEFIRLFDKYYKKTYEKDN